MTVFSFLRAVFLAVISSRIAFGSTAPSHGLDALEECPSTDSGIYDYIVVGSGAGGGPIAARLAENGFSVLVIETGVDQSNNTNTTLVSLSFDAIDDPTIDLNYTISEYPAHFPIQRNNIWYPRASAIGGCTIHNAMINSIGSLRQIFDNMARMLTDSTWSRDNMQSFYALLERNLYLTPPNPNHGFDGWLNTSRAPVNFSSTDPQWEAIATAVIDASGPVIEDLNSHLPLPHFGRGLTSRTTDTIHRSSIRDRLDQVAANSTDKLTLMTNTLATKVLLCKSAKDVVAYGVSVAPGAKLPIAQGFTGKQKLNETRIIAKREVIVSAGAFQSPQLLMLSGIGDSKQLAQFGIPSVVHLPGVGSNLQDNDELPALWELRQNFTDPVSFGEAFSTSAHSTSLEPDIDTYFIPAQWTGFVHGLSLIIADTPNFFSIVTLKALASSKGYVHLTGSHPQDLLDINKLRFQAPGGRHDIAALREGVKRWREVMNTPKVQKFVEKEVLPGANVTSDEDLDNYVVEKVFGHHACCTNAIGPDDDPQAVLDGDFHVRGVQNLRVVDASSWPKIPGYYPTSPTYMIAEKAAQVIMRDAKRV
ncbi:glucose-methanol-choline oxidoreductase-like protein [Mycena vulgaris]|nr:glucose-methanol-choline oxidoreductase-like protein [Mycena vulgaris]